jgi:hypothetical protein
VTITLGADRAAQSDRRRRMSSLRCGRPTWLDRASLKVEIHVRLCDIWCHDFGR